MSQFRLLRAAREAEIAGSRGFLDIVNAIQDDHIKTSEQYIKSPKILSRLIVDIKEECVHLLKFLDAAQTIREVSPKSEDTIISTGEKLSCRFVAALLNDRVCVEKIPERWFHANSWIRELRQSM
jgi:aspartate kinase